MKRGGRGQEEDEIDNSEHGGKHTSLERHSDELGDDIVSCGETGSRLVEGEHERAGNEDVGKSSESKPQDDDRLEFLELAENQNDLDANSSANGAEERDGRTAGDQGRHPLVVHQLVHTPSEEDLRAKGNDTGHDGVGSESGITLDGVVEVSKVRNEVLVDKDLIENGVDGVGEDEEEDKVPHEGFVRLEVDIVDVSLDDGESIEPNVEHATDVHAPEAIVVDNRGDRREDFVRKDVTGIASAGGCQSER